MAAGKVERLVARLTRLDNAVLPARHARRRSLSSEPGPWWTRPEARTGVCGVLGLFFFVGVDMLPGRWKILAWLSLVLQVAYAAVLRRWRNRH